MNNKRRKIIDEQANRIQYAMDIIDSVKTKLDLVLSDEEDAFDSMPENLQYSMRGEDSQEAIDILNNVISSLDDAYDSLADIC